MLVQRTVVTVERSQSGWRILSETEENKGNQSVYKFFTGFFYSSTFRVQHYINNMKASCRTKNDTPSSPGNRSSDKYFFHIKTRLSSHQKTAVQKKQITPVSAFWSLDPAKFSLFFCVKCPHIRSTQSVCAWFVFPGKTRNEEFFSIKYNFFFFFLFSQMECFSFCCI